MIGLQFLDLVIGLVFIYLIYSLAASTLWEILANFFSLRARNLKKWILETLDEEGFGQKIIDHPIIKGISREGRNPSYIPSKIFSEIFLEVIQEASRDPEKTFNSRTIQKAISESDLLPGAFKVYLLQKYEEVKGDVQKLKGSIEYWFDSAMHRIGGTYKKNSQKSLLLISIVLVSFTNVDSVRLISYLHKNPEVSESLATKASLFVQDSSIINYVNRLEADTATTYEAEKAAKRIEENYQKLIGLKAELDSASLPLSWKGDPILDLSIKSSGGDEDAGKDFLMAWLAKLVGLFISALAISLGAPFWFETLNKLVDLRGAGKNPSKNIT